MQWAQSIAEEARKGGDDQHELEWDSYEKIKAEIIHGQLQLAEDKAKAKEMITKVRAEKAAKAKEIAKAKEEKARLAREHKEKKQQAKARAESKREARRKSEEDREKMTVFKRLKLKVRLTKVKP